MTERQIQQEPRSVTTSGGVLTRVTDNVARVVHAPAETLRLAVLTLVSEGSFTADRQQPFLQLKLHARDPFPLRFISERMGGRVYGPYSHQGRHYFSWLLRGPALRAAIPLFRAYLPESWKREQFEQWLERHGVNDRPLQIRSALAGTGRQSDRETYG